MHHKLLSATVTMAIAKVEQERNKRMWQAERRKTREVGKEREGQDERRDMRSHCVKVNVLCVRCLVPK